MTLHCETPLVQLYGNSVIFGDQLGMLPMLFQPVLFYPDWLFMTWPLEIFYAYFDPLHPFRTVIGGSAMGWSITWWLLGIVCGFFRISDTFTDFIHTERPFWLQIPTRIFAYLLFWHIVIGRVVGVMLTRYTEQFYSFSEAVRYIAMITILIPPILGLIYTAFAIGYFVLWH